MELRAGARVAHEVLDRLQLSRSRAGLGLGCDQEVRGAKCGPPTPGGQSAVLKEVDVVIDPDERPPVALDERRTARNFQSRSHSSTSSRGDRTGRPRGSLPRGAMAESARAPPGGGPVDVDGELWMRAPIAGERQTLNGRGCPLSNSNSTSWTSTLSNLSTSVPMSVRRRSAPNRIEEEVSAFRLA